MINKTTRSHYEKYKEMARDCHVTFKNKEFPMDRTKETIIELFKRDNHLNNIPLYEFDSYFYVGKFYHGREWIPSSLAENVCMYKHLLIYEVVGAEPVFVD